MGRNEERGGPTGGGETEVTDRADLSPEEKARRSRSFGSAASHYGRWRPGPPDAAVDWLLPDRVARVVDLGAGTGGLTRLLVPRADEVVAVEPDARMRSVLAEEVPAATVAEGRGEDIPLPAGSAAAVLASSSWHWVDPPRALPEVARVLEPGGTMGALWGGPDPEGPFMVQAREVLAQGVGAGDGDADEVARRLLGDAARSRQVLELVDGVPFTPPVHEVFTWERAMTADDLVGLLGTFSWVILMEAADRERLLDQARRLLVRHLGLEGGATVDVAQRCDAWRTTRTG